MEKEILKDSEERQPWRTTPRRVLSSRSRVSAVSKRRPLQREWRLFKVCARLLAVLTESGRMVRLVGPNHRPLERYQFEDPVRRDLRQFGGGSY